MYYKLYERNVGRFRKPLIILEVHDGKVLRTMICRKATKHNVKEVQRIAKSMEALGYEAWTEPQVFTGEETVEKAVKMLFGTEDGKFID